MKERIQARLDDRERDAKREMPYCEDKFGLMTREAKANECFKQRFDEWKINHGYDHDFGTREFKFDQKEPLMSNKNKFYLDKFAARK